MNVNFAKSPHSSRQNECNDQYLTLPVVYLNNIFQAHRVDVYIPQTHTIEEPQIYEPTQEQQEFLSKYGLCRVEPSQERARMPAYLTHDQIQMLAMAYAESNERTRLLYLYAAIQTSPYLFPALNDLLPEYYRFSPFYDFLSNPVVTFGGCYKMMQLSPIYLRERPEVIIKLISDCFTATEISVEADAESVDYYTDTQLSNQQVVSADTQSEVCYTRCCFDLYDGASDVCACYEFAPPHSTRQVVNISIMCDEDERIYKQILKTANENPPKSYYFELKRVEVGKLFVYQARERYDAYLLYKFHYIMSANNEKQISTDTLQLAVTMLFFDKLDLINYFSTMQKCSYLSETKNKQFGWPTLFPPPDPLQAIANMISRVDDIQQIACKYVRVPVLNDIYYGYYIPAKKIYEQQINRFSNIKFSKQDVRVYTECGVKMCEIKMQMQGATIVRVPYALYDAGVNADPGTESYKAFYTTILDYIQAKSRYKRSRKDGKDGKDGKTNIEETDAELSQAHGFGRLRQFPNILPKLAQRADYQFVVLYLIKAGKLNTLTIFDLDDFFDLCFRVCTSDNVGYPLFYYSDYAQKAGFGLQTNIIRAGKAVYAVLLNYIFADRDAPPKKMEQHLQSAHQLLGLTADEPEPAVITLEVLQKIQRGEMDLSEFITRIIDQSWYFYIPGGDISVLSCCSACRHEDYDYDDDSEFTQHTEQSGDREMSELCPDVYDYENHCLRPGFALFSPKLIFADAEDLDAYCSTLRGTKRVGIQVSRFYSPLSVEYACYILQAIDMLFNLLPSLRASAYWMGYRLLFGAYLSSRGVDITYFKQRLFNKFYQHQQILERANSPPGAVEAKHFEALRNDYDEQNIYAELFRTCMQDLDYRIAPSYYLGFNPMSSLFSPLAISLTYESLLYYNMFSPEDVKEIQQQEVVDKELFVYPPSDGEISPDYEPEVDPSVLKKENIIVKLKTVTQNYKIMPEEMYLIHQRQHPEQFDLGIFEQDRFHAPASFDEVRQLANSVLNRGKYFTIPFGSEAQHISNDIILDNDIDDATYSENKRARNSQAAIKSQYLTFSQPTGAEARVCHIEEEYLCFGLFMVRTAELLKIFIEWMAIYTPSLLHYFSLNITPTVAKAPPEVVQHYRYRYHIDQQQQSKMSNFFYQNQYKYYCEDIEEPESTSEDSDDDFISPFSTEFDDELRVVAKRYHRYTEQCANDEMLLGSKILDGKDEWVEHGCYAPVYPWLLENEDQISATPPPPRIPALLQLHLTQLYTTGQVIIDLIKNPVVAIPVITRTLYHMLTETYLAEYRASVSWRLLYPESYYKSIDHATITLIYFDKKYTNSKTFQQDISRRIKDSEAGINPNALDACIDISLPRIYDYVYFSKYLAREKAQLTAIMALQYEHRMRFYYNFVPESAIRMFFKFSTIDYLSEVLRLCDEMGVSQNAYAVAIRLSYQLSGSYMQAFDYTLNDPTKTDAMRWTAIPEELSRILSSYSYANASILLPSDELTRMVVERFVQFQDEFGSGNVESCRYERSTCDPPKMVYIEDMLNDLNKSGMHICDAYVQLYTDDTVRQVIANLKQLTYESPESQLRIRQQFEKCVEQNAYIPALFDDKRELRDTQQFYTRYRHMSLPTCTLRSLFMLRSVLFYDPIEDSVFDRLMHDYTTYNEMATYFRAMTDNSKREMYSKMTDAAVPKQFVQQNIPSFYYELAKKMLFDDIFIPLLSYQEGPYIRYIDYEMLSTLRLLFIVATRLEFSLRTLDLPVHLRNAAVYGTRSMHPFPYNFTNALNFGSSFYGYDIKQHFEQQSRCQKQLLDSVYAQCSQKIFYGHYPYINLMNTSDSSVCGCRCQQLKCTFCGGIGAGYNGTLSGSINNKYTTPIDQAHTLCNGIMKAPVYEVYDWDDMVNVDKFQYNNVESQLSLLYKMPTVIPRYKYENYIFPIEDDTRQARRARRGSKGESSEEEEDDVAYIERKLAFAREKPDAKRAEYFIPFYGSRLCDTTFMIPPVPQYYCASRSAIKDKFYEAWLNLSYYGLPIRQIAECPMSCSITEHLLVDSSVLAVDDPILSTFFQQIPRVEDFHFRNIIKTSRDKPSFREFYHLFNYVQYQKDDELTSECQAVLGIYAYPFLTIKRHMNIAAKRVETLAYKLVAHHIDLPAFQVFKSSKSTSTNCLTVAFALFALWQYRLPGPARKCMPWSFCRDIIKYLAESDDELYICENYDGFVNIYALLIESSVK